MAGPSIVAKRVANHTIALRSITVLKENAAGAIVFSVLISVALGGSPADVPVRSTEEATTVTQFDQPFSFAYQTFERSATVEDGVAHLLGKKSQGGAGVIKAMDLSPFGDHSPALWAKVGPTNRAKAIKMFFASGEGKRMFSYSLEGVGTAEFRRLLPADALAVAPTSAETDEAFNPAKINMFQFQGDWSGDPVDVFIDKIELVPPTAEMLARREALEERLAEAAERKRREAEQRQREVERLLAEAPHPEDGPSIDHAVKSPPT